MWKILGESVAGTSHRRTELPCQDSHRCEQIQLGHNQVLIAICSDGAGSAELSQVGSRIACDRFFEIAYGALTEWGTLEMLDRLVILDWYESVRAAIEEAAGERGVAARQLACTLLTAIVGVDRAWFSQVGDGSIVYREGGAYESVFWPQAGEYANTTNFVTQGELGSVFEFDERALQVSELALFTDGLQRLALDFGRRAVHQRFFEPMFASLRAVEHADELTVPFRGFLDSALVNERTDDDKTLVLAMRRNGDVPNETPG